MPNISWTISQMWAKPSEGSYTDVVVTAEWYCTATEGEHQAYNFGTASFYSVGDPFTPYEDLTQDQVLGWCWNVIDKDQIEAQTNEQLQNMINPPVVSPALPWASADPPA